MTLSKNLASDGSIEKLLKPLAPYTCGPAVLWMSAPTLGSARYAVWIGAKHMTMTGIFVSRHHSELHQSLDMLLRLTHWPLYGSVPHTTSRSLMEKWGDPLRPLKSPYGVYHHQSPMTLSNGFFGSLVRGGSVRETGWCARDCTQVWSVDVEASTSG